MRILPGDRLFKGGQSLTFLFLGLYVLLATTAAVSGEAPEPFSVEAAPSGLATDIQAPAETGFVFEESSLSGKAPSVVLPEPDDCLEPPGQAELPRIAIIIDDMGHHQKLGGDLLDLDLNLTFSFLPHAPFTREQEELAWAKGRDILVHMPMEPRDAMWDPGPGALYLAASAVNIALAVEENLALVPHAVGVNNHMGSKFTADRQAMHEVLSVLQQKNLFFVDSLTAAESVGGDEARKMGIRTASRHVFLDNSQAQEDICRQLKRLVAYAKKHGTGIAIAHPSRATVNALSLCREMLLKQVRVVGVHELVN